MEKGQSGGISIIFPHLISEENNALLDKCLKQIEKNTHYRYEVLYLASTPREDLVYKGFNFLVSQAKYELVCLMNTDIFLAKDWDVAIVKGHNAYPDVQWWSLKVVESGNIPSAASMISHDFGKTADEFNEAAFDEFVKSIPNTQYENGFVWFCPSVLLRDSLLEIGGFPTEKPFPHPSDIDLKNKAEAAGWKFIIANHSWAYHFQNARRNSEYRDKYRASGYADGKIRIEEQPTTVTEAIIELTLEEKAAKLGKSAYLSGKSGVPKEDVDFMPLLKGLEGEHRHSVLKSWVDAYNTELYRAAMAEDGGEETVVKINPVEQTIEINKSVLEKKQTPKEEVQAAMRETGITKTNAPIEIDETDALVKGLDDRIVKVCTNLKVKIYDNDTNDTLKKRISDSVRTRDFTTANPSGVGFEGGANTGSRAAMTPEEIIQDIHSFATQGEMRKLNQIKERLNLLGASYKINQQSDVVYEVVLVQGNTLRVRVDI